MIPLFLRYPPQAFIAVPIVEVNVFSSLKYLLHICLHWTFINHYKLVGCATQFTMDQQASSTNESAQNCVNHHACGGGGTTESHFGVSLFAGADRHMK
jgi:hypothetical protein